MSNLAVYFWVAAGSALGGVARFWLSGFVADRLGRTFPWGTLVVNVSGSLIIGLLASLTAPEGRLSPRAHQLTFSFLMMGVCGGYTTFSSFSLQTLSLAQEGQWWQAAGNMVFSAAFCLGAVWLGYALGQILNR